MNLSQLKAAIEHYGWDAFEDLCRDAVNERIKSEDLKEFTDVTGIPIEFVSDELDYNGEGADVYVRWKLGEDIVQVTAWWDSWEDYEFCEARNSIVRVEPKEKTITVYEPIVEED